MSELTKSQRVVIDLDELIAKSEQRLARLEVILAMSSSEISIGQIDGQAQTLFEMIARLRRILPKTQ